MNEGKKVGFAYSRLSQKDRHLEKEEIETSLINAKKDIDNYCTKEGIELLHFSEEKYRSGAKWDRSKINEVIAKAKEYALAHDSEIESGDIVVQFIFKNLSRMAREGVFQEFNLREMEDYPYYIQIVSIEEGEVMKDRSLRLMIGAMNERKVLEGRKSTERRHDGALSNKVPPIKAPFGYWNDKNLKNWAIDKNASKKVILFWEMFADGRHYSEICEVLDISSGKYHRILNGFENYLGKIIYRKKTKTFKGEVVKVDRLVFDGQHKPILTDPELIEKIKQRLDMVP